ncbi:Aste57867_22379 [Aphanomyces stellatus]|uniref:Aste57867_22379 protein n=1 Tax=Aphanomyces stellatus TaxID=120398 RepID=A0A485LJX5_9STRA|nr:hypothetical protein As57867_022309 [Aphanomyces stellatus]VFT99042.1 Aste57867_22379 [Aphanomyces stellatus]
MQLIIELPFLGGGGATATMTWDTKHTILLGVVLFGCSYQYVTPLVWAISMLLVVSGYALFAPRAAPGVDAGSNKPVARNKANDDAVVLFGGNAKIAGTTKGHGDDPKRLYYTVHVEPAHGRAWTIDRSYNEFRALYVTLCMTGRLLKTSDGPAQSSKAPQPKFPKRVVARILVNQTKRTQGLAAFLQYLVNDMHLAKDKLVAEFLGVNSPARRVQEDAPVLPPVPFVGPRHELAEKERLAALSMEERAKVDELQAHVVASAAADVLCARPLVLVRYISNHAWEIASTKAHVDKAIEWRQQTLPKFDRAVLQNELQTGKMYVSDLLDADLNAVVIVRLHLENSFPQTNYLVNAMYTMERALLHASPVHHCTIVIDFSLYAFKHGPEQGIFFQFVKMMEAQYLVHVHRVILYDLPWHMTTGFNMMKPFFDPVTRSKFVLAKSSDLAPIQAMVDTTALVQHVGKEATYPFNVVAYLNSPTAVEKTTAER